MKITYKILTFNILSLAFGIQTVYAQDQSKSFIEPVLSQIDSNTPKTVLKYGVIQGYVHVPEGIDPTTVVVQIAGISQFNLTSEDYFTNVDASGYFSFKNIFSVGSSVQLVFWDQEGILTKRSLLAYASKSSSVYDVTLQRTYDISNLSQTFGQVQDFNKAGICGQISGYSATELKGSELYLQDNQESKTYLANYFDDSNYPNQQQKYLSSSGGFCFFNLESPDKSYTYYARLKLNDGSIRTFPVYAPDYTFLTNIEIDGKSSLFRPIEFYSFNLFGKDSASNKFTSWSPVEKLKFTTNFDYDSLGYQAKENSTPIYFPVDNEFIHIDYSFEKESQNHFFVLFPRTALFTSKISNAVHNYRPGQTYVDYHDPVVLKVLDSKKIANQNPNLFEKISKSKLGSAIVNIDTSEYSFQAHSLKFYLRNLTGQNVSQFIPLGTKNNSNEMTGYFLNIPLGYHELFVTVPTNESNCDDCTTFNESEKLIWSYLVFSVGNNTQIITNASDSKILIQNKLAHMSENDVYVSENAEQPKNSLKVETIPVGKIEFPKFYNLPDVVKLAAENSMLKADVNKLCYAEKVEKKAAIKPTFMNLVPLVSYLPPSKIIQKYITRN